MEKSRKKGRLGNLRLNLRLDFIFHYPTLILVGNK